jgi:hypothetical protein
MGDDRLTAAAAATWVVNIPPLRPAAKTEQWISDRALIGSVLSRL